MNITQWLLAAELGTNETRFRPSGKSSRRPNHVGGVCTNTGTVPSKTLRAAALDLTGLLPGQFQEFPVARPCGQYLGRMHRPGYRNRTMIDAT